MPGILYIRPFKLIIMMLNILQYFEKMYCATKAVKKLKLYVIHHDEDLKGKNPAEVYSL